MHLIEINVFYCRNMIEVFDAFSSYRNAHWHTWLLFDISESFAVSAFSSAFRKLKSLGKLFDNCRTLFNFMEFVCDKFQLNVLIVVLTWLLAFSVVIE